MPLRLISRNTIQFLAMMRTDPLQPRHRQHQHPYHRRLRGILLAKEMARGKTILAQIIARVEQLLIMRHVTSSGNIVNSTTNTLKRLITDTAMPVRPALPRAPTLEGFSTLALSEISMRESVFTET
ncbi:MAG: hypothetical protein U0559_11160 [Anaerolineae bacterium]